MREDKELVQIWQEGKYPELNDKERLRLIDLIEEGITKEFEK